MSENGNEGQSEPAGSFEELIQGIETEMNATRLHKQGAFAITSARIAGSVYSEAMATGVPHDLAKEMAQDTWNAVMCLTPVDYVPTDEDES
ncbi:hypothetical protein ACIRLA_29015 [Streptomyces sp. NPDC102364]|uniref:hypothetical protein n=1 Tax=Streptomyces sp. NPDC102364 TaxID=3366161 RepID=UPI003807C2F0